ncbi:hypothetical protein GCM10007425_07010 [Lysinibacillus alkalisoli]|uniref:Lipoprotein n=1 Tax=Lysinibacillus alkalisoli TaxID=1911548 RepID=A0A917FZJ6_9BACI|nr:hypothetical protein [Lysinibacillus alkalisoli]GGG15310.1 hypothetical protein GCM10007425_07010 [Lysinibacillus alkalisoli]
MKKCWLLWLTLLMLTACQSQHNTLAADLQAVIQNPKLEKVELTSMVEFDWQEAYLFPPYTQHNEITSTLGFPFSEQTNVTNSDNIYLLVFLHEDKIIESVDIHRAHCDFTIDSTKLTPDQDTIYIQRYS